MSPSQENTPERLDTWAEIAQYLGVSEGTARTYAKKFGMPVHRLPSERSRVWAIPSELDNWFHSWQRSKKTEASEPIPLQESSTPQVSPEEESPAKMDPMRELPPPPRRQWNQVWMLSGVVLACIFIALFIWQPWRVRNPHHLVLEGKTLVALAADEHEVWRFPLVGPPVTFADGRTLEQSSVVADLDGDGMNEALLYVQTAPGDSSLYCISHKGKELWSRPAARPIATHNGVANGRTQHLGSVLGVLKKARGDGAGIVAGAHSNSGYGTQIAALRPDGSLTAEYWHPGWIISMLLLDLDGDGREEILLGGINHSFDLEEGPWDDVRKGRSGATLVVLDHDFRSGQGRTRHKDDAWTYDSFPQGTERDVLFFNAPIPPPDGVYFSVRGLMASSSPQLEVRVSCPLGTAQYSLDKHLNFAGSVTDSGAITTQLMTKIKPAPSNSNDWLPQIDRILKSKMWRLKPDEGVWHPASAR